MMTALAFGSRQRLEHRHHFFEQGRDETVDRRIAQQDGGDTILDGRPV